MPSHHQIADQVAVTRRHAVRVTAATAGVGAALLAARAGAQVATPTSSDVPADFNVVLHAAQADHWQYVQSNIENLMHEWPQARLRVVVDGTAVNALLGHSDLTAALATAIAGGLELYICPNALREHGIAESEIPLDANFALGGVIALVLAHQEGYVYVKP